MKREGAGDLYSRRVAGGQSAGLGRAVGAPWAGVTVSPVAAKGPCQASRVVGRMSFRRRTRHRRGDGVSVARMSRCTRRRGPPPASARRLARFIIAVKSTGVIRLELVLVSSSGRMGQLDELTATENDPQARSSSAGSWPTGAFPSLNPAEIRSVDRRLPLAAGGLTGRVDQQRPRGRTLASVGTCYGNQVGGCYER